MAVVRDNPLPVGEYWIRLQKADTSAFAAWRAHNKTKLFFRETTENTREGSTFYRFAVKQPVIWLPEEFGYPNASEWGDRAGNVDQAPEVETPSEIIENAGEYVDEKIEKAGGAIFWGVLLAAGVAIWWGRRS